LGKAIFEHSEFKYVIDKKRPVKRYFSAGVFKPFAPNRFGWYNKLFYEIKGLFVDLHIHSFRRIRFLWPKEKKKKKKNG
jgi:hypothetical protein